MKAADLDRARDLIAQRAKTQDTLRKLEGGEPLRLMLGAGDEIVLSASFLADLRADLARGLSRRVDDLDVLLRGMGVEP